MVSQGSGVVLQGALEGGDEFQKSSTGLFRRSCFPIFQSEGRLLYQGAQLRILGHEPREPRVLRLGETQRQISRRDRAFSAHTLEVTQVSLRHRQVSQSLRTLAEA